MPVLVNCNFSRQKRNLAEPTVGSIFTPHVCDMFVCNKTHSLSVCVLLLSQPNGQMYELVFWHVGKVEGYLGQF